MSLSWSKDLFSGWKHDFLRSGQQTGRVGMFGWEGIFFIYFMKNNPVNALQVEVVDCKGIQAVVMLLMSALYFLPTK